MDCGLIMSDSRRFFKSNTTICEKIVFFTLTPEIGPPLIVVKKALLQHIIKNNVIQYNICRVFTVSIQFIYVYNVYLLYSIIYLLQVYIIHSYIHIV